MPSPDDILAAVAARHHLSVDTLHSPSKLPRHVRARDEAAHELRRTGMSLGDIGNILHRDHSSILTAIRRHENHLVELAQGDWAWLVKLCQQIAQDQAGPQAGRTHHETCYQYHHACALLRVEAELRRLGVL